MKKLAILNCKRAISCCTGASCFMAFNRREYSFAEYAGEDVELSAFWYCNGCDTPLEDKGLQEKIARIKNLKVDILHLGVCTQSREGKECPVITKIANCFEEEGIKVVRGTH